MNLKLFIEELQDLYASFDDEYKQVASEPEIRIEKSGDGCYDIINFF